MKSKPIISLFQTMKIRLLDFHCLGLPFSLLFYEFRLKVLPKRFTSEITAMMLTFRDGNTDITYCPDLMLFSARDVRRAVTDCGIFSAPIPCVLVR